MNSGELLKEMGERIYKKRKELRLTQEELAEKLGVSTQMISNLELGKKAIRPENLVKLCFALGVSADYVLTGKIDCIPSDNLFEKISALSPEERALIEKLIGYMNAK